MAKTHGMAGTRIYGIWQAMIKRCYATYHVRYHRYGGRGITVCDEWRHDFVSFYKWAMANGYADNLTLDRKDNDGNYLYNGVLATLKDVKADSIVDIRVTFDKTLIKPAESFINKSDMIALDDIIALETEKANKSNKEK